MLQGVENNVAMTTVDMALTFGATYEHSASLLDVAYKHCNILQKGLKSSDTSGSKSRTRNIIPGYITFTKNAIRLLKEANKSQSTSDIFPANVSLCDLISSAHLPLSLRSVKDHVAFWNSLHVATVEFQAALGSADDKTIQSDHTTFSSSSTGLAFACSDGYTAKAHVAYRKLLEICRGKRIEYYIYYLNLGCLYPVACVRSGDGVFYILLRNATIVG
jgi:hypothetical protein